jgi:hypothetical protein
MSAKTRQTYEVLTPLVLEAGKPAAAVGTILELTSEEAIPLLGGFAPAIRTVAIPLADEDKPGADARALGEMTKAELHRTANDEGVQINGLTTNKTIAFRIEAVRAAHDHLERDALTDMTAEGLREAILGLGGDAKDEKDVKALADLLKAAAGGSE